IYTADRLRREPCRAAAFRGEGCTVVGAPYARTLTRNDADRIRNLYARNGYADADVRVDVVELPKDAATGDEQVRLVYNVDEGGPLGGYELQNNNLHGRLQQGAIRFRANGQHQLLRFEFFDPRFRQYAKAKFSPLTASLQYSRDVSVTRFFRSTIDRGSFGIV